ncbi:hypothetical protein BDN70DRAFT_885181 [Pholiota conissans]|uniref:Uncharacterized protein n=1 Tax=Pholiota conissans TaxID=109636 RepID=A0A9P5YUP9_9AGAR|nr:hypothetical protein BDN70DRAFT_885181 [Pholiota conissans]
MLPILVLIFVTFPLDFASSLVSGKVTTLKEYKEYTGQKIKWMSLYPVQMQSTVETRSNEGRVMVLMMARSATHLY